MQLALFYVLAGILLTFSLLTVTARNPVRSAVYLISALLAVAGLFFLLEAEFVGAVQVLVYVGGIMVLFLFVIMLVSVREIVGQSKVSRQWKTGVVLTVVLSAELVLFVLRGTDILTGTRSGGDALPLTSPSLNTQLIAKELYGTYVLPFEIVSVLLLVAIIGAVVLAKKEI